MATPGNASGQQRSRRLWYESCFSSGTGATIGGLSPAEIALRRGRIAVIAGSTWGRMTSVSPTGRTATIPYVMGAHRFVLVVDDDASIASLIRSVLEDEGLRVETAGDGAQALQRVAQEMPDLIVLDLTMPVLNGPGFVHVFRDECNHQVPILIVAAEMRLAEKAEALQAYDHLAKPFDLNELVDKVQRGLALADCG